MPLKGLEECYFLGGKRFFSKLCMVSKYSEVGGGSFKDHTKIRKTLLCVCVKCKKLKKEKEKKNNCYVTVNLLCILCATGMKGDIAKYSALLAV